MSVRSFNELKKKREEEAAAQQPVTREPVAKPSSPARRAGGRRVTPQTPQSTGSVNHASVPSVPAADTSSLLADIATPEEPISFQQRMAMQGYEEKQAEPEKPKEEDKDKLWAEFNELDQKFITNRQGAVIPLDEEYDPAEMQRYIELGRTLTGDETFGAAEFVPVSERAKDAAAGWGQRTGATLGNTALTLLDVFGQSNAYSYTPSQLVTDVVQGNDPYAVQEAKIDDYESGQSREAMNAAYSVVDDWFARSEENIGKAKEGLGFGGKLLIDLGMGAADLAVDAVANAVAPGSGLVNMGARAFGSKAKEIRDNGGDLGDQLVGGLTSAGIEVLTEKIAGPFEKIYGKSMTGKAISTALDRLDNPAVRRLLSITADAAGEGTEEMLSNVLNAYADRLLDFKEGADWKAYEDIDLDEMLYEGLIGAILGAAGSVVSGSGQTQVTQEELSQLFDEAMRYNGAENVEQDSTAQTAAEAEPPQLQLDPLHLAGLGERGAPVVNAPANVTDLLADTAEPAVPPLPIETQPETGEILADSVMPQEAAEAPQSAPAEDGIISQENAQEEAQAASDEFNSKPEEEAAPTVTTAAETAAKLKADTGTSASEEQIANAVQELADYIASNGNGEGINQETLNDMAMRAAAGIINEVPGEAQDSSLFDELKNFLYGRDIRISDELRGDVADYNLWRRSVFGKLRLRANSGTAIDSLYHELGQSFGTGLFPPNITSHSKQIDQILHVLDMSRPQEQMWFEQVSDAEYEGALNEVAKQILDSAWNMESGETAMTEENLASLGENAPPATVTPVESTVEATGPERERGFSENMRTTTGTEENLRSDLEENPETYRQLGNKDVLAKAQEIYDQGLDVAQGTLREALGAAQNGAKLAPEMVPLARMVANELARNGDVEAAHRLIADVAAELTAAGQLGNAAKILRDSDPATAMQTVEKALEEVNKEIEKRYGKNYTWRAKLTQEEIDLINGTDFTQDGAFEEVYETIAKRLGAEMPSTLWEKISELRRVNMLLRPRTQIKNFLSNAPMLALRKAAEKLSGTFQDFLVKTGKLDADKQTRTASVPAETRDVAKQYVADHKAEILEGGNKADMDTLLNKHRTFFKDGPLAKALSEATGAEVHNLLEGARRLTYSLLEAGDAPFVLNAYQDSLAQIMAAQGVTNAEDITQEMRDFAYFNAMEATYKAANVVAQSINAMKRKGGAFGKALDVLIPFTTTPANITTLLLQYSPVGFINMVNKAAKDGDLAGASDSAAKATVGTAMMLLGFGLRALGAGSIGKEDDEENAVDDLGRVVGITGAADQNKTIAAFDKARGVSPYSFGGRWSYDWAEPFGSMLALGAEIYDSTNGNESAADAFFNAIYTAGDAVLNMSIFQNVTKLLKGYGSNTQAIIESLTEGGASQLAPGLIGDVAKIVDPTVRSTWTGGNAAESAWARVMNAIPGLSDDLPANVNVFGEDMTRGNLLERTVDALLNPGLSNRNEASPLTDTIVSLYESTGKNDIFPVVAPYSIDGDKLTGKEREAYQTTAGKTYTGMAEELMGGDAWADMSDEQKAKALKAIRDFSNDEAKKGLAEGRGGTYSSNKDRTRELYEAGVNVGEYAVAREQANTDGNKNLSGSEVYEWLLGSDYTDEQKALIWEKDSGSSKSWDQYLADLAEKQAEEDALSSSLATVGVSLDEYNAGKKAADKDGSRKVTQAEMFDWLIGSDYSDEQREAIWDTMGWSKSWEAYAKKKAG